MLEEEKNEYLTIAKDVNVFTDDEILVIKEVLEEYAKHPGKDYFLLKEQEGNSLLGFLLFGKNPLTQSSWEIYWLVVNKKYHGQGLGKQLLKRMEYFILQKEKSAILRVETSSTDPYTKARNLYKSIGFQEAVCIPDFYNKNDSWILYYKKINIIPLQEAQRSHQESGQIQQLEPAAI